MTKTLFRSMRIPFLILTPVSIYLGLATASTTSVPIHHVDIVLVLLGALSAHIGVNTLNEYHDFRSGLDAITTRTPFSGGSGALIDNPAAASAVLYLAITSLITTILTGLYFVFLHGLLIAPFGIVGIIIISTYTQWLNRNPLLCLLAPGIGFGPLMVIGTHVALTGEYSAMACVASLIPFFLASNLLLLNQYPDIAADKRIGRRHIPIVFGIAKSTIVYGLFAMAACVIILFGIHTSLLPSLSAISLIPLSITIIVYRGVIKHCSSIQALIPYLTMNVIVTLLTPLLLGVGILLGSH